MLCRQFVYTAPLATLALIRQATGDPAGALEAIDEAEQASPGPGGLLNPVPARRTQLLLVQGDLQAAARFTQVQGVGPADEPAAGVPLGYLAQLLRAFGAGPPARAPGRDTAVTGIVDPLTSRELEVLKMLAGRSNQALAVSSSSASTPSRSTWAMSWASSARPTAPRPWPAPASRA